METFGIIQSVPDFLSKTHVHYHTKAETRFFCRGQSSMELKLRPKIGRSIYSSPPDPTFRELLTLHKIPPEWVKSMNAMFSQFEREYITYHSEDLSRKIDRLALAQHYGLATQFLDWTLNPLIALYFACESQSKTNGIVFIFGPHPAYVRTILNDADLDKNDAWQIFHPRRIDQRMVNQDAAFTFHKDATADFAELLGRNCSAVAIPATKKPHILNELQSIGIHKAFVYPGLGSVCDRIDSAYRKDYYRNIHETDNTRGEESPIDKSQFQNWSDQRTPYLSLTKK